MGAAARAGLLLFAVGASARSLAGGAALVWLSGTVVGAINSIPILPKVMELVGLGYSTWFVYRYVLYKDSRKELVEQFDALKNKVSGEF